MGSKLKYIILVVLSCLCSMGVMGKITIFMIGDSTMANKPVDNDNPERGWGQMLQSLLDPEFVCVENHAMNGRSSKSFIDEGRWAVVLQRIKPGDYVFIQFGHNDEKTAERLHTVPGKSFDENLRRFVNETRSRGGIPVLFNSIVRRNFRNNPDAVKEDDSFGKIKKGVKQAKEGMRLVDTHGDYLKSPEVVAHETNAFFIDMNKISHQLVEGLGPEKSKKLFCWVPKGTCRACPEGREDNTHLNVYGARLLSKLTTDVIVKEIKAFSPFIRENDYVVANDGSGDFLELDKAVAFINNLVVPDEKPVKVLLRKGSYHGEDVKFSVPVNLVMEKEVEFEYK